MRPTDERFLLSKLPDCEQYEESFLHRDIVTCCIATPKTDFLITGSQDGFIKFWKKFQMVLNL